MINACDFVRELKKNELGPIYEVPCSIFKGLLNYLFNSKEIEVVNPVNEGIAMAQAAGSFISTKKMPIVMMQNSGLNNTLNCITSLNKQYGIPAVYLISWRGESKDAPEHEFMGEKLEKILETYQIPSKILTSNFSEEIKWATSLAKKTQHPSALIMKKGYIEKYKIVKTESIFPLSRWEAIETIVDNSKDAAYIATNGFPSRQAHNILKMKGLEDGRLFAMVGSMGHALGIGIEEARNVPKTDIVVIDGDGSALMHLGTMASVSEYKPKNLIHVILDNGTYNSTGGQPTQSPKVDFKKIGKGFGYSVYMTKTKEELKNAINKSLKNGPALIHVKINSQEFEEEDERMKRLRYSCKEIRKRHSKYLEKFK